MLLSQLNLFIVGAAKSGTTSLWHALKENPRVLMPKTLMVKEPAYFSNLRRTSYRNEEKYRALFTEADHRYTWIGEASTAYLSDPDSARRIYHNNPETRIIILLRNPVARARSLYNWMAQDGYEYAETFEEALALEKTRKEKEIPNYYEPEYYYNYMYFSSGLYYSQVKRYKDLFGDNVIIVKFEDFTADFEAKYKKICDFLSIAPNRPGDEFKNESNAVASASAQFLLRKWTNSILASQEELEQLKAGNREEEFRQKVMGDFLHHMTELGKVYRMGMMRRLKCINPAKKLYKKLYNGQLLLDKHSVETRDLLVRSGLKKGSPKKMKPQTAAVLKEKYRPDIEKLSALTGMDFSRWMD